MGRRRIKGSGIAELKERIPDDQGIRSEGIRLPGNRATRVSGYQVINDF